NLSILKLNILEQRATNRLHHCTLNLIVQVHLVNDRATLKTLDHSLNLHAPGLRVHRNFCRSRNVTPLLKTTRDAAPTSLSLLPIPTKRLCGSLQNIFKALVLYVLQTKRHWIHLQELG